MQSTIFANNTTMPADGVLAEFDARVSSSPMATFYLYPTADFDGTVIAQATLRASPTDDSWTTLDTIVDGACTAKQCLTYNASTRYIKLRLVASNIKAGKIRRVAVCY